MATRRARPGRQLIIFFLGMAVLFGLVALAGTWKPSLGLDLQGGTRITLRAAGNPTDENLEEARRIIDERVNGSGVTEAEVTTQGGKFIVVEVPGKTENRAQLEETVRRQAQLRFRLVACSSGGDETLCAGQQQQPLPGMGRAAPGFAAADPTDDPSGSATTKQDDQGNKNKNKKNKKGKKPGGTDPTSPAGGAADPADPWNKKAKRTVKDELAWTQAPDQRSIALYTGYTCGPDGTVMEANEKTNEQKPADQPDDPDTPIVACEVIKGEGDEDDQVVKYLLSRSVIEGTELDDASAGVPQNQTEWVVNIGLGNDKDKASPKGSTGAADDFETISRELVGSERLFAIVLDGKVLSAPRMTAVISDGNSMIEGDFSEQSAIDLANSLKFGALPIAFSEKDTTVEDVGPSLAGNQLSTGLLAGAFGVGLVMLYCLLYYRGLGAVVVASLFVGAAITYAMVLLLSETAGFTMTLPGIAGLHHRGRHHRGLLRHLLRANT